MSNYMNSNQLRQIFIEYFKKLDHEVVSSSSLVNENDPTLLFTNSGMVQFKDVFLGIDRCPYQRAVSIQKCMRAGGKHNDLENVGYTSRHHTFFEMLGNFSFGDYFKREAIDYAWRFLTEVLELPKERLWVTVFGNDPESEAIWLKEMKIDPQRFSRCGEKENFWQMGDSGPCGPCTEIFYDHGPTVAGGPPGSPDADGDRYVEIWNLVFIQYNRDLTGKLYLLAKPSVDTGMGLERIAAVMQGVHDNYDIELFQYLLKTLGSLIGNDDFRNTSMRVIVDHIRSAAFLIADGVIPSNEGRGYVLRRIIRRAVRHGYKLGQQETFFYQLVTPLTKVMGDAYPEPYRTQPIIEQVIYQEEIQFSRTLSKGLKILDQEMAELSHREIPGEMIFQLYDTYGFPPDLTADIARERNFTMDYTGFNKAMERQREQSQQAQQFTLDHTQKVHISGETEFIGYETLNAEASVTVLLEDNKPVTVLNEGRKGVVVLDRTPFYAESGGQVGDRGYLFFEFGRFRVKDTQKQGVVYLHIGEMVKGTLHVKDKVEAKVDSSRFDIMRNHSATHLLHEALRRVLGNHVMQKGSLVEAKHLRFDFSHPRPMIRQELQAVEKLVNQQIQANLTSNVNVMTPEEAKEFGALALFGERYRERVRVLKMGDFSTEICGGTHTKRTGEIGLFKIVSESACAAGIRRIEAVTGQVALSYIETEEEELENLSNLLKTNRDKLILKLNQVLEENRNREKELIKLKRQMASQQLSYLINEAVDIQGVKVLTSKVEAVDHDTLRAMVDELKQKLRKAAIVLAIVEKDRVQLISGVTKNSLDYFNATELLMSVAVQVGGRGGGRPDMAQGGGDSPERLNEALDSVYEWVKEKLTATAGTLKH
ncbi:Alanine--tRNA ligase [Candidatus Coxiella mudrowiae]|uniref:Alanine--tRNA ligase n=2 Tax=Candidatus Coxiella mudrowiae TaxID=2054173 RepID=A0ABN4HR22_9COXI|nr:Alanine--tRNA ligase [Candidatus Coxiella mudrowiae]